MSALIWLPLRSQFWADNGVELLADGSMEAVDTAAYISLRSTLTKDTTLPHSGSRCLRITSTAATPLAGQAVATIGRRYHEVVWGRYVSGAQAPSVGDWAAFPLTGVMTHNNWQLLDLIRVAGHANMAVGMAAGGVGDVCEFDDWSVQEQFMYTANLGSLKGKVQLGDGRTAATFPTQLTSGRGVRTPPPGTNNVWLVHPTLPAMGSTGSVVALVRFSPITIAEATTHVVAMQGLLNTDYSSGWLLNQLGNNLYGYWGGGAVSSTSSITSGLHCVAMTCDGSMVRTFVDGVEGAPGAPGGSSVVPGLCVGGVTNAGFNAIHDCDIRGFGVYPYALTPTQLRNIEYQMRLETNQP